VNFSSEKISMESGQGKGLATGHNSNAAIPTRARSPANFPEGSSFSLSFECAYKGE